MKKALFPHIEGQYASTPTNGLGQTLDRATRQAWSPSPVHGDISQNELNNQSGYGSDEFLLERPLGQLVCSLICIRHQLVYSL